MRKDLSIYTTFGPCKFSLDSTFKIKAKIYAVFFSPLYDILAYWLIIAVAIFSHSLFLYLRAC
jgi:hypothetical protein